MDCAGGYPLKGVGFDKVALICFDDLHMEVSL